MEAKERAEETERAKAEHAAAKADRAVRKAASTAARMVESQTLQELNDIRRAVNGLRVRLRTHNGQQQDVDDESQRAKRRQVIS